VHFTGRAIAIGVGDSDRRRTRDRDRHIGGIARVGKSVETLGACWGRTVIRHVIELTYQSVHTRAMTWIERHRLLRYLNDSIWVAPSFGILAGIITSRVLYAIDRALEWKMSFTPDTARMVLITLSSSMFSFVVFLASALLIALQLASAQLTPRIMALVFRDPLTKIAMTLFVFTFTLSLKVVIRISDWVPRLTVITAAYSCVLSLIVFLYLIDHIGKMLRPNEAMRMVALLARKVIEKVYPRPFVEANMTAAKAIEPAHGPHTSSVPSRKDGVVIACDIDGIVSLVQRADCVLEMVPQLGDFVAKGAVLFHVYGDASGLDVEELIGMIAIGQDRSLEQDPGFAFRILVDIAAKALSPAVNDPTTAVLAIDQIHHLLRTVGGRDLDDERVRDAAGRIRLIYRTPGWDDFVNLAVTEIRQFGAQSIQVNRRLRAMLESLIQILPPARDKALRQALDVLKRSTARSFLEPEDRAMAAISDSQGMGGRAGETALTEGGNGETESIAPRSVNQSGALVP
jgi:uncharacterized membrane protein